MFAFIPNLAGAEQVRCGLAELEGDLVPFSVFLIHLPFIGIWMCGLVEGSDAALFKQPFSSVHNNDTELTKRGFDRL
jgi:hypothetical protein